MMMVVALTVWLIQAVIFPFDEEYGAFEEGL